MSGNLLPFFFNPATTNGANRVSSDVHFGSKAPAQFDSNFLFGSLMSRAMNAHSVSGAVKPMANAALGALALNGSNGVSNLGMLLINKVAAKFHTDAAGLQEKIQQMLVSGQSMESIAAQLASELANTISEAVSLENGSSGIITGNRLLQAFSQALAPPGTPPPQALQGVVTLAPPGTPPPQALQGVVTLAPPGTPPPQALHGVVTLASPGTPSPPQALHGVVTLAPPGTPPPPQALHGVVILAPPGTPPPQALQGAVTLAPTGKAPPLAVQGAAALAQRFALVANIVAAGATQTQDVGQQYRYPGRNLDAITAEVSPAPDARTTDPSNALSALALSIQATLTAALPAPPSGSPTTTTNGGPASLQARISASLSAGASTDSVVKTLASSLANAVAQATSSNNATTANLEAAFAQRLSAPKGGTPDQIAVQLAVQATAIVQQSAAQITSGVTAGAAVMTLAPSVVSATPGGSDVLQRTLQRAQNAALVANGAAQAPSSTPIGVSASGGQGAANTGNNAAGNANLSALLAQAITGGSNAASSVDAFLSSFTQAMTDLRNRENAPASADASSAITAPSNGTQAFLASIGSIDLAQNAVQAPPAPSGAPNPTDPNNVVDQVLKGIFLRNAGDATEVRMKLQPADLGDVHVKLSVDNGNVSAIIIASTADVRDTLLANQNQLSRHFADAGLKLQQFSVDVGSGQGNPFAQQRQASSNSGASSRSMMTSADDAQADEIQSVIPTFGPPILVGVNRGLLDYLV